MIHVTPAAQQHFTKLLKNKKKETQIRVFVVNPGKTYAKCGICFCPPEEFKSNDIVIKLERISIRIDLLHVSFLKNALIDVLINELGNQLTIKAPNVTIEESDEIKYNTNSSSLEEKIKNVLQYQINPQLKMHGGSVSLVRITEDSLAIIQFYGGCNGCMMATYTIKEGIENTLRKLFPELKGVLDVTQHQHGEHSYY